MSLIQPAIGVTVGPTWSSELNTSLGLIDTHDHTSGKGVQITPSGLNINADLEFNANDATELRTVAFDSSAAVTSTGDTRALYHSGGDIYWRNATGTAVQITDGSSICDLDCCAGGIAPVDVSTRVVQCAGVSS